MDLYYLGPNGTYCEKAAKNIYKLIDNNITFVPVSTISKVVELVNKNDNKCAVLPFENSIEGIVRQTIDNLYLTDIKIQSEINVKVEHCLLSKTDDVSKIKTILSHPQALAQCSNFITENFNENIELTVANSTADAAAVVSESDNDSLACIASFETAKLYNLNVIYENIGNIKENRTRFVLISKNKLYLGEDKKTSIAFNTKNEPGALLRVLEIFDSYGLNLTYLESRPSKKAFGEYNFFADIDKPYSEIIKAIKDVKEKCNFYKLLGSYSIIEI